MSKTLPGPSTSGRKRSRKTPSSIESPSKPKQCKSHSKAQKYRGDVHLLDKKASVSAAASSFETQWEFTKLVGLTDPDVEVPAGGNFPCPLADDELEVLAVANSHLHSSWLERVPHTDGLYIPGGLDAMLEKRAAGEHALCDCIAHSRLVEQGERDYKRNLKQLMRAPDPLAKETGLQFAQSFLGLLLTLMGEDNFVVQVSGMLDGVSYVLLSEDGSEHHFRGYLDFVLHYEGDIVANRILVVMGEMQSTNSPAVQNAICAVGNLERTPLNELLVLTIFKNKTATLSIARLIKDSLLPPSSLGVVSLKYYATPNTFNLKVVVGVRDLAAQLHHYLRQVYERLQAC